MDYHHCALLLVLSLHIEIFLDTAGQGGCLTPYVFGFGESISVPAHGEKQKTRYYSSQFYMTGFSAMKSLMMELGDFY
jgi:hypothetical protein